MAISAAQVSELRQMTGAGMMECKKALVEKDGDMEAAIKYLRERGVAKADKSSLRTAAEGAVIIATKGKKAVLVEINAETDFVARHEDFKAFSDNVASLILENDAVQTVENLADLPYPGENQSLEEKRRALVAKIGENIQIRRFICVEADTHIGTYIHSGRIGVLVNLSGGTADLAKSLAMHIAAAAPLVVKREDVSPELVQNERDIFSVQAAQSGKPADIIAKMVDGRINKFLDEMSLVGQPYVKDPNIKVEQLLKTEKAEVLSFVRFVVGEGIEKKQENFAEEVMAQVRDRS